MAHWGLQGKTGTPPNGTEYINDKNGTFHLDITSTAQSYTLIIEQNLDSYVLFATQDLLFKGGGGTLPTGGMIVGGNIGVNNVGGTLRYSTDAIAHMSDGTWAVADDARSGTETAGTLYWLYANTVNPGWTTNGGATVLQQNPATSTPPDVGQYPWTAPLLTSLPPLPFTPSYQRMELESDLTLGGAGGTLYDAGGYDLDPGNYRDVEFKAPGTSDPNQAIINLVDGVYNMRSLKVFSANPGVVINVRDGTILQIDMNFDAGDRMRFGANHDHHGCAKVYVGAIKNSSNDYYNPTTERVTNWGHDGRASGGSLHMQYYAPNGWLDLGGDMELYGRYWAYRITGDPGNNVYLQCIPTTTVTLLSALGPIALGDSVTDKITIDTSVNGVLHAAGETWTVEASTNPTFVTGVNLVQTGDVIGSLPFSVTTDSWTPPSIGTWYFRATYSGDSNYHGSQSTPTDETLIVNPETTTSTKLSGSKTVTGHIGLTYTWDIEKTVTPEEWDIFEGDTGTSQYTITVTKSAATITSAHVEGTITVTNEGVIPTEGLAILDEIYYGATLMGSASVDVSPMPVLAAGESYDYHYNVAFSTTPSLLTEYTNKATITITNGDPLETPLETSKTFDLTEDTANDNVIHVEDSNIPEGTTGSHNDPWDFSTSDFVTYAKTFSCDDEGTNVNTATIQETGQSDDATVTVNCYELEVTKDANTEFTRTYTWDIEKNADPTSLVLVPEGQDGSASAEVDYFVTVDAIYVDSDWKVEGTITIHNPAPIPAEITDVSDIVSDGIVATVDLPPGGYPYTLYAGETLELDYYADLLNGYSRTNTATVTIRNHDYIGWDLTGDWIIDFEYDGSSYHHSAVITQEDDLLTGVGGGYPDSGTYSYAWDLVSGWVPGDSMEFTAEYTFGAVGTMHVFGNINPDGSISGVWDDNVGGIREGTWETTSGSAIKYSPSGTTDFTGEVDVSFGDPTSAVDEKIDVTDTLEGFLGTVTYGVDTLPKIFTYTRTIGPYEKPGKYTVENCTSFVTNDNEYTGEDCAEVNVDVPLKFFAEKGTLSPDDYTVELNSPTRSEVIGLYSGPQVWWKITYYVKNTYDSGYYFTLWDKWGGNLMALGSEPTAFDTGSNQLTLKDEDPFVIDYAGYGSYIGDGKSLLPDGSALITLHTGAQQQGTNPGGKENEKGKSGKGTQSDGNSYDVDIAWEIGWLAPNEEATLTIYVAPGLNPAGKLEFTSEGCTSINTGPVLRAWDSIELQKKNFEFAESFSNTLEVCVEDLD